MLEAPEIFNRALINVTEKVQLPEFGGRPRRNGYTLSKTLDLFRSTHRETRAVMGQSVSINAVSAGAAGLNVKELEDVGYEKTLSSARFMKCIRARHRHGLVVVKVAMRPAPDFKLTKYAKAIRRE